MICRYFDWKKKFKVELTVPEAWFNLIATLLGCQIGVGRSAKCHLSFCSEKSSMLRFQAIYSSNLSYLLVPVSYF